MLLRVTQEKIEPPKKDPAVVALGRRGGLKSARFRSERLSPTKRKAIAKKGPQKFAGRKTLTGLAKWFHGWYHATFFQRFGRGSGGVYVIEQGRQASTKGSHITG